MLSSSIYIISEHNPSPGSNLSPSWKNSPSAAPFGPVGKMPRVHFLFNSSYYRSSLFLTLLFVLQWIFLPPSFPPFILFIFPSFLFSFSLSCFPHYCLCPTMYQALCNGYQSEYGGQPLPWQTSQWWKETDLWTTSWCSETSVLPEAQGCSRNTEQEHVTQNGVIKEDPRRGGI